MKKLLFLVPVLDSLDRGSLLRRLNAILLYTLAIVIIIGVVYGIVQIIDSVSGRAGLEAVSGETGAESTTGSGKDVLFGIIAILSIVAFIVVVFQLVFTRATLLWRAENSRYSGMQSLGMFIKVIGEFFVAILLLIGVDGMFMLWIYGIERVGRSPSFFPIPLDLLGEKGFPAGILVIINALVLGILVLTFVHFVSENVTVFGDIAKRLTNIEEAGTVKGSVSRESTPPPLPTE